jgi:hypothetical protein
MIDYEHIPFRCHKFHEHDHLFRDYNLNVPPKSENVMQEKSKGGFTQVKGKGKQGPKNPSANLIKAPSTTNSFDILNQIFENQEMEGVYPTPPNGREA